MEPPSNTAADLDVLLAGLERKLAELDRLQHDLAHDAHALAWAASHPHGAADSATTSVYSIRDAATDLGVSISMVHKLIRQRRLGHFKVGARTLITAEHLARFRQQAQVDPAQPLPQDKPGGQSPSAQQRDEVGGRRRQRGPETTPTRAAFEPTRVRAL